MIVTGIDPDEKMSSRLHVKMEMHGETGRRGRGWEVIVASITFRFALRPMGPRGGSGMMVKLVYLLLRNDTMRWI